MELTFGEYLPHAELHNYDFIVSLQNAIAKGGKKTAERTRGRKG